jgi:hypothetical protein
LDKVKLSLLYCLRYEGDPSVKSIKLLLEEQNLKDYVNFIDYMIQYSGKKNRSLDVFHNKDFIAKSSNFFKQAFTSCPNVYTKHSTLISSLTEKCIKGKSKEELETLNTPSKER